MLEKAAVAALALGGLVAATGGGTPVAAAPNPVASPYPNPTPDTAPAPLGSGHVGAPALEAAPASRDAQADSRPTLGTARSPREGLSHPRQTKKGRYEAPTVMVPNPVEAQPVNTAATSSPVETRHAVRRLRLTHRFGNVLLDPPGASVPEVTAMAAWRVLRQAAFDPGPVESLALASYTDDSDANGPPVHDHLLVWVSVRHGLPLYAKGPGPSRPPQPSTWVAAVDAHHGRLLPRTGTAEETVAVIPEPAPARPPAPAASRNSTGRTMLHLTGVDSDDRTVNVKVEEGSCRHLRYFTVDPTPIGALTLTAVVEIRGPARPRIMCTAVLYLRPYRLRLPNALAGRRIDICADPDTCA